MALKGTIKDFGVADIFQLISQQAKTGVLVFKNDVNEVKVYFRDGWLVAAGHSIRTSEMLLGNLMVRAEVMTQRQLNDALQVQQRTLQKLGDVLIEQGLASDAEVREFARLQMTETVYSLFEWSYGTYEFDSDDIDPTAQEVEPIRAETIVMNGIRMTDEWPSIRERIPSYSWLVEPMRPLPLPSPKSSDEFDLSSLTDEIGGSGGPGSIGDYERRVYELIAPGRSVQKLIDLSRLGEFETCSALSNLMSEGYIRVIKPPDVTSGGRPRVPMKERLRRGAAIVGRMALSAGIVVVAILLVSQVSPLLGRQGLESGARFEPSPVDHRLAEAQIRVLRRAVEVFRYQTGRYPERLEELVEAHLVRPRDLRFPYEEPYYYRAGAEDFVLLRPYR